MIRKPVVAGQFYPNSKEKLEAMISSLLKDNPVSGVARRSVKGVVLPHAGYQYSGAVAAQTVSCCELKDTLIILGPNHTGLGKPFSVMTEGSWHTPLGDVAIDSTLAQAIVAGSSYLKADTLAHHSEHSIEVLIPFLQFFKKEIRIVPIVIAHAEAPAYKKIADDIVGAVNKLGRADDISFVASSDMTHYEPQKSAQKKDRQAIEAIEHLDMESLLGCVESFDITMCGVAPVSVMLEIVKKLGAREAHLVKYQTSGDASGDYNSVVGYAGMRIY